MRTYFTQFDTGRKVDGTYTNIGRLNQVQHQVSLVACFNGDGHELSTKLYDARPKSEAEFLALLDEGVTFLRHHTAVGLVWVWREGGHLYLLPESDVRPTDRENA